MRALCLAAALVAGCATAVDVPVEGLPAAFTVYGFSFRVPRNEGWVFSERSAPARDHRVTLRFRKTEPDRDWVFEVDTFPTTLAVDTVHELSRHIVAFRGWSRGHLEHFGRDRWDPAPAHGAPCARAARAHSTAVPPPVGRSPWTEYVRYTARDVVLICSVPHVSGQIVKFRLARLRPVGRDDRIPWQATAALRAERQDESFDAVATPFIAGVRYTALR